MQRQGGDGGGVGAEGVRGRGRGAERGRADANESEVVAHAQGRARMPKAETRSRYYPADAPVEKRARVEQKPTKLKAGIKPGSVLIVLAGRYRGKRVVFLRQLPSGLLLVTGACGGVRQGRDAPMAKLSCKRPPPGLGGRRGPFPARQRGQ